MIFFLESLAMYSFMDDFIVSNFQKKNEVMPFEFYSLIKIVDGFYISLTSEKMKQKHV